MIGTSATAWLRWRPPESNEMSSILGQRQMPLVKRQASKRSWLGTEAVAAARGSSARQSHADHSCFLRSVGGLTAGGLRDGAHKQPSARSMAQGRLAAASRELRVQPHGYDA